MLGAMFVRAVLSVFLLVALTVSGDQLDFDFNRDKVGEPPPGFESLIGGQGSPGDWRVVLDEVPSLLAPLTPGGDRKFKKGVLAQLDKNPTDEHFPMLIYHKEEFADFKITTRFKLVSGEKERMAGIAFRFQDTNNYYYIRASGLGSTFNFFKVIDGQRSVPISHQIEIPSDQWHEVSIECKGTKIQAWLNGQEALPPLDDRSLSSGKIGFWTKSDSVVYFTDTRIQFEPRVSLAQSLVEQTLTLYERLLGLKIAAIKEGEEAPVVIASDLPEEVGTPAWKEEAGVIHAGEIYYLKKQGKVTVSMPLRDRNGIPVAAVRVVMKSFAGQTEKNAIARALIVVKSMEPRVLSGKDLMR